MWPRCLTLAQTAAAVTTAVSSSIITETAAKLEPLQLPPQEQMLLE